MSRIRLYINSAPPRKRTAAIAIISAGFLFPLILLIVTINIHGAFANVIDFGPLRYAFLGLLILSLLVALATIADIFIRSQGTGNRRRFPFITTWILASLSTLFILAVSAFIAVPHFMRTGDTSPQLILIENPAEPPVIAVAFYTQNKTKNILEWAHDGRSVGIVLQQESTNQHWLDMMWLENGKTYSYELNGQAEVRFNALPAQGQFIRFAAAGDPHFGNPQSDHEVTRRHLDYIKNPANNFSSFFVLGDTAHLGFMDSLWKEAFSTISACSSTIPVSYVIGNHDTLFGGLELYRDYLCPPDDSNRRGNFLYKRIDVNNTHFLLLDVEWDARTFTADQEKWLLQQLDTIPRNDWCVVMSHTFYYCSGLYQDGWAWYDNTDTITRLCPIFEKYGVDMVLSGHKHQTEVLQKNGVTYVVVGSLGGPLDPERTYISPASVWYKARQFGIADVTIKGDSADIIIRGPDGNDVFKTTVNNR